MRRGAFPAENSPPLPDRLMARAAGDDLTDKQAAFVREYLVDMNAAAAARRAGYSESCARQMGRENLTKPYIASRIQEALEARAERTEITADRVVEELVALGLYDPADIGDQEMSGPQHIRELPEAVRRAIVGWKWDRAGNFTLKLADKLGALRELAKHLGVSDRLELSGPDGEPLPAHQIHVYLPDNRREDGHIPEAVRRRMAGTSGNGARG